MRDDIILGARVPAVRLGYLLDGEVATFTTDELFASKKVVVLGIPGAFTPVCSKQHVPDFVANADRLLAAGFDQLICIAPNDPFALDAWRREVDPDSRILFVSDGNLEFCDALGLTMTGAELFLGRRSQRYMLIVHDRVVQRVRVEQSILSYSCTRAREALLDA
jgi:peroxiredoxin